MPIWKLIMIAISAVTIMTVLTIGNIWLRTQSLKEEDIPSKTMINMTELADKILRNMDQSVNPCDNFYQFACGGFINSTVIPKGKNTVSTITLTDDQIRKDLKVILEQPILSYEPKPFQLAKHCYKTCMNETAIEKQGFESLRNIIKQLGGWPVLEGDKWNKNKFDWIETTLKFESMGYSANHLMHTEIDSFDGDRRCICVYPKPVKLIKPIEDDFFIIATKLGADNQSALTQFEETKEFGYKLSRIVCATNIFYPMNITELSNNYSSIPWKNFFNHLISPSTPIDDNEIVYVKDFECMKNLENFLMNTDKRIIANYMIWKAIKQTTRYLNEDVRQTEPKYTKINRWEDCIDRVSKSLDFIVGSLYIRKHFHQHDKNFAVELAENIRNQLYQTLANASWMDGETKKYSLNKAKSMLYHIGYLDELLDESKLKEYYKGLEFSVESYLEQQLKLLRFYRKKYFGQLREPVDRKFDWRESESPTQTLDFYNPSKNLIEIPAGYLQSTLFNKNWPKYINYGAIGSTIGHDITHGYDTSDITVWTNKTFEKSQCLINQYENYRTQYAYSGLNASETLDENIADNGGIKLAYLAYLDWLKKNGEEEKLPNMNWSSRQLFWISAANSQCSVYEPKEMEKLLNTSELSPDELRINGPFSNMPEFAKDFNCPVGSQMNPVKKCSFW